MKKHIIITLAFSTLLIFILLIFLSNKTDYVQSNSFNDVTDETIEQIANEVDNMTLEEKVGQMFIIEPEVLSLGFPVTNISQIDIEKMQQYNIGGFIMRQNNIITPNQITTLNNDLKAIDSSLFISVSEEGGEHTKIANIKSFPVELEQNMSELGLNKSTKQTYESGYNIGNYLHEYGFNLNFAPVCDLYLNPDNTLIEKRTFGSDPQTVGKLANGYKNGLNDNKVFATAKHFPGYGNVSQETFEGFAVSYSDDELLHNELIPFQYLIDNNVNFIMTSLAMYPNLSDKNLPAALNPDIVNDILIEDLGYEGIIITDALNHGAFSYNFQDGKGAVEAIIAGNDIILMPTNFYESYDAIIDAVHDGTLSEERIDKSVTKILIAKSKIF